MPIRLVPASAPSTSISIQPSRQKGSSYWLIW